MTATLNELPDAAPMAQIASIRAGMPVAELLPVKDAMGFSLGELLAALGVAGGTGTRLVT